MGSDFSKDFRKLLLDQYVEKDVPFGAKISLEPELCRYRMGAFRVSEDAKAREAADNA